MRVHLLLSGNTTPVPFDHLPALTGAIHKWIGRNGVHDATSLYSFSWLQGGRRTGAGLRFERAAAQHLCFSRNEDLMLPDERCEVSDTEWQSEVFPGFELLFEKQQGPRFKVGHNRYADAEEMFGRVVSYGDPIRKRTGWI